LKDRIAAYGGTCTAEQTPQRVDLAYPIEQRRRHGGSKHEFETAYFGWLACELTPEAADALGHELRNDTGVLRHILVQTTQAEVEHSKERAVGDEHAASADSTDEEADADGAEVGTDEDSTASSAHA
jgi:ribosomal protein S6